MRSVGIMQAAASVGARRRVYGVSRGPVKKANGRTTSGNGRPIRRPMRAAPTTAEASRRAIAHLSPPHAARALNHLPARAEPPGFRFHDLRRTAASLPVAQGVHPRVVMEILGHSQIALTMSTYAHVLPENQREAMAHMDALFPAV